MSPVEPPESGLNAAVAAQLRGERAAHDLTVEQLAEASDVPYASLRRYLNAKRHIDVAVLDALAKALGTDAETIVRDAVARAARPGATLHQLRPEVSDDPAISSDAIAALDEDIAGEQESTNET